MYRNQENVIKFLSVFGCGRVDQIKKIVKCTDQDIQYLIKDKKVNIKKGNVLIHKKKLYEERMILALDALLQYKYTRIFKGKYPVNITFFTDKNVYDIIVTSKADEQTMAKVLNTITDNDRIIMLFQDLDMLDYIRNINKEKVILYCTYPPVKAVELIKPNINKSITN